VSFLHVYHHAMMLLSTWVVTKFLPGNAVSGMDLNVFVFRSIRRVCITAQLRTVCLEYRALCVPRNNIAGKCVAPFDGDVYREK
jgi:hypothetical protein